MGPNLLDIVDTFIGNGNAEPVIYRIPEEIILPPELVLLHEHTDHHVLQCTKPMDLQPLNTFLTRFLRKSGQYMSLNEFWALAYDK
ncbi:hypothetical protein CALCODRAFT_496556 [Calocera cornea HHB12733]|uniref:Tse2 ADP-ribosyltransferase toxin domain-containing protein n=1 Tax=Calocera cornea HHB12733 TaxID=1353952 RepID=A0A165FR10_9BASI|nr:hypothetical protein CALCODRAFT_496556 [Calocera cornea HHB12733]